MNNQLKAVFVSAVMGVIFMASGRLYADIVLDPSFTGTVIITSPEGDIKILQPGEPVPAIADKSTIEVFNGDINLSTGKNDSATLACGKASAAASAGGSASVSCGEKEGKLKVVKGPIEMIGSDAEKGLLEEGKEYPFGKTGDLTKKAPATADVEDTTGTTPEGDPPVDSRSIQASQSQ